MLMPLSFHSKLPCTGLSPAVLQIAFVKPGTSSYFGKRQSVAMDGITNPCNEAAGTALSVRAYIAGVTASVRNEVLKCTLVCHKLLGSILFSYVLGI